MNHQASKKNKFFLKAKNNLKLENLGGKWESEKASFCPEDIHQAEGLWGILGFVFMVVWYAGGRR